MQDRKGLNSVLFILALKFLLYKPLTRQTCSWNSARNHFVRPSSCWAQSQSDVHFKSNDFRSFSHSLCLIRRVSICISLTAQYLFLKTYPRIKIIKTIKKNKLIQSNWSLCSSSWINIAHNKLLVCLTEALRKKLHKTFSSQRKIRSIEWILVHSRCCTFRLTSKKVVRLMALDYHCVLCE